MPQGSLLPVSGLILAAVIRAAWGIADVQPATAECRRESAIGLPSWVTSGVWQGGRLLVVDVVDQRLTQISGTGVASEHPSALGSYLRSFSPVRIREGGPNGGKSFMVEVAGGELVEVDRNFTPQRKLALAPSDKQSVSGSRIETLLDWVWAGDQVIGYADLGSPGEGRGSWKNGFVRFNVGHPNSFSVTRERVFPDNARVSMTLTYPLIASIGTTGYIALVDGKMGLWRFGPKDRALQPMKAFPKQLDGKLAPLLPSWLTKDEFPGVMAAVERESMPAGLWAWSNSLFLLFRSLEDGHQRWYLTKIDPFRDKVLWTVPVPVPGSTNHIAVIPGQDEWAFLEKGPVTSWLNQETHHILFVKSTQLRSSSLKSLCF